jgi:DNA-directed RNA polymerase specialized sigma24 family protein
VTDATLDQEFSRARGRDPKSFARWMARVEHPIRASLARFARAIDAEVVMQETFLRMWLVACDPDRPLEGTDASLRFALRVARNVALEEVRRAKLDRVVPLDALMEDAALAVEPEPPASPALGRAIEDCIAGLSAKPARAFRARIERGVFERDQNLAESLGMSLNTFLQNVTRARQALMRCLERKHVSLREIRP